MYYRYIKGDTNEDGSRYLPFNDDDMIYNNETHEYEFTNALVKTVLGIDLKKDYGDGDTVFRNDIKSQVYERIGKNPNNGAYDIVEFKIGRTKKGRDGIKQMFIAQIRYAHNTGEDLNEWSGMEFSKRAEAIGRSDRYGRLGFMGSYSYRVNLDATNDDGYRNGY